jgi:glycosyltransferase involved in cell wall biosynthesis
MVTHNGERFLRQQCESIFRQTLLPAALVVVDDASSDSTPGILAEMARIAPIPVEMIAVDRSDSPDLKSRVTANLMSGLAAVPEFAFAVLSDQDDEWLPDRVAAQRAILRETAGALLVAGDGILIDEAGHAVVGRLRDHFPVPQDWDSLEPAVRARAALRRSLVTGAASAMKVELVALMSPVPKGWLLDRWATLVAVARDGLRLQPEPVIRYRIHDGQTVGLRQARVGEGQRRWSQVLQRGATPFQAGARAVDVVRRVRPITTDPALRIEFSWAGMLRAATDRA